MSSYWWPLARFTATENPSGAAPTAAAVSTKQSKPTSKSPAATSGSGAHGGPSTAADMRHLANAAFHTSLEGLLVESTKHRSLVVLRDAVLETRQRQYDPASLFDTLCIACSLLAERSAGTSSGTGSSAAAGAAGAAKSTHLPSASASAAAGHTAGSGGGGGAGGRMSRNGSNSALPALGAAGDAALETSLLQASVGPSSSTVPALAVPHVLHYRHHAAARTLLLQSIGDVGKLIALGLLPVTQQVGQRVADLLRELAFIHAPPQQRQQQPQPPPVRRATVGFGVPLPPTRHPPASSASHTATPQDKELLSGMLDLSLTSMSVLGGAAPIFAGAAAAAAGGGGGVLPAQLVHDDPVLVRLLQMLASAASSCPLGSPALAELCGTLLLFYCGVAPQSMLEATCEATLTHHIHSVLTALHDSASMEESGDGAGAAAAAAVAVTAAAAAAPGSDDAAPHRSSPSVSLMATTFTAQLQGVAFVKDMCRLMIGARTRWLQLSPYPSIAAGGVASATPQHPPLPANAASAGASRSRAGSSSIAGITARVVADADRQRTQQQRTPRPSSAATTPTLSASTLPAPPPALQLLGREGTDGSLLPAAGGAAEMPFTAFTRHHAAVAPTCEAAPVRLRLFLLRTVTLFFKEQAKTQTAPSVPAASTEEKRAAGAAPGASMPSVAAPLQNPLYMQCLNDCFFSVALWGLHEMGVAVPMQPPPPLLVEVLRQAQQPPLSPESPFAAAMPPPPLPQCSLELFTCTQQLALVSISTHLGSMTNATQVLLEAHVRLLRRLSTRHRLRAASLVAGSDDDRRAMTELGEAAERLVQAATAVLSLWRKTLTSTSLLWDLLQVQSVKGRNDANNGGSSGGGGGGLESSPAAAALLDGGEYRDRAGSTMGGGSVYTRGDWRLSPEVDRHGGDAAGAAWRQLHTPVQGSPLHRQLLTSLVPDGRGEDARDGGPPTDTSDSDSGYRGSRGGSPALMVQLASPGVVDRELSDPSRSGPQSGGGGGRDDGDFSDAGDEGGGGGGDSSGMDGATAAGPADMPSLIRCITAVLKLVVAHMQLPARSAGVTAVPGQPHDHVAPGPAAAAAAAADASLTLDPVQPAGPFLLSITPPYQPTAEDSGIGGVSGDGAALLGRTARELDGAARRQGSHGAAAGALQTSRPLCLCATSGGTVYQCLTEALNCIATFGQFFSQLVDAQQLGSHSRAVAAEQEVVLRRCRTCFLGLHPHLLRCTLLCLRHLRYEEDVLPVVLKATGYWVQVSCALQLAGQRDAYLTALVDVLRTPDPVVGHLVALSSPAAAGTSDASATVTNTAVLEGLLMLHDAYAAAEPVVPGSVAAAVLGIGDDDGDDADGGSHGRGGGGGVQALRRYAQQHMPSWGAGWLRRRRPGRGPPQSQPSSSMSFSTRPLAGNSTRTVSPSQARTAIAAAATSSAGPHRTASPAMPGGSAATASTATAAAAAAASHASSSQQQQQPRGSPASSTAPSSLVLQGWHAPSVQHVVVLGVCRLQHKVSVMKTLHVIANTLGAQLDQGWALLARGLVVTEPLLHKLKRLLAWVEEAAVEQEQQAQLLSDASHLRDALRSLCVNNTCQLPASQLDVFMSELVSGTEELSMANATDAEAGDGAREADTWGASSTPPVPFQAPASYVAASRQLPRQDPQGCADQWVLTSECLSVSLLSMLPFTEQQRFADAATTAMPATAFDVDGEGGGGTGKGSRFSPLVTPQLLQRQCTSALARAMRLWELETHVCHHVTDRRKVEQWGTTLLTTMGAHKRALLALTAGTGSTAAATTAAGVGGSGGSATSEGRALPAHGNLSGEETRVMEGVLATVVGHIAAVAVQLCRSAARRRRASEGNGAAAAAAAAGTGAAPASVYQVTQSAALVLTSGPFASAPLTQVSNALFAAGSATGASGTGAGASDVLPSRPPLLPFTRTDAAAQSTSALLAALNRSTQAIALHTPLDDRHRRRAGSAGSHRHTRVDLDPLEQLLASPFGMLDTIYAEWRRAGAAVGSSAAADVLSKTPARARGAAAPAALSPEAADNDAGVSPNAKESPAAAATPRELAALVVADAVPQLLDNAAGTILVDVVKVVQAYGESIDGAAWEAVLALLQRTATCPPASAVAAVRDGARGNEGGASAPAALAARGDLRVAQSSVSLDGSSSLSSASPVATKPGPHPAAAALYSSQAVESLNTAFRALESIQHNHIPHLNAEGLHRLIVCVGAFTVHRVDSGAAGERKLHTNLSAVQLLWSIADYLAAFGAGGVPSQRSVDPYEDRMSGARGITSPAITSPVSTSSGSIPRDGGGASPQQQQQQDRLWCSLLWQLRNGCLDDRQEVRQSALQTLFALVQTYGWRFSAVCWRCVLRDVLLSLMEVVTAATELCATPAPTPTSGDGPAAAAAGTLGRAAAATTLPPPLVADEAPSSDGDGDAVVRRRLLRSFAAHPPQLEEVRVTLYDAGSRLFVTHYAHMRAAAEVAPLSSPLTAPLPLPPSYSVFAMPSTDRDDATVVLERFLCLCGDVCVVVRGTSGEQSAVAAVHALHGVLVEMPGPHGLHERGIDLAWLALERLLLRGGAGGARDAASATAVGGAAASQVPFAHTEAKQCTLTVVAATVAALCDSFRLQRHVAAAAGPAGASASSGAAQSPFSSPLLGSADRRQSSAGGFGSYFSGWGGGGTSGGTGGGGGGGPEVVRRPSAAAAPTSAQYFTRLLFLLQAVPRCPAVVHSYYFPSKAQSTLLEGVAAVWPTLSSREARMVWGEVLLPAFPPAAALQRFVLQDAHDTGTARMVDETASAAAAAAASTLIPLKSVMPPGSHPGYLSAVMETMRRLLQHHHHHTSGDVEGAEVLPGRGDGAASAPAGVPSDADRVRLAFMAPSTVQVTGTLLLLHLASAAALAGPPRSGSVPFTLPALFLQECVDLLQYTLWGPVLARDGAAEGAAAHAPTSGAAVQCRRDGVAALCRVFEVLLTATSTVVRQLDATTSAGGAGAASSPPPVPGAATATANTTTTTVVVLPHVTAALQALELLVDTLGEVVHHVMEHYDDVVCATAAINVLSIASAAEGLALARVARRSLSLLQRWAGAVGSNTGSGASPAVPENRRSVGGSSAASPPAQGSGTSASSRTAAAAAAAAAGAASPGPGTSRSQLQDVVRASMETRNRAILRQYVDNPDDASAAALLLDTLHDVLAMAEADARSGRQQPKAGIGRHGVAASANLLRCLLPELLQLVACGSRSATRTATAVEQELELRALLAKLLTLAVDAQQQQQQPRSGGRVNGQEEEEPTNEGDTSII